MTSISVPKKAGDVGQNLIEAHGGPLTAQESEFLEYAVVGLIQIFR